MADPEHPLHEPQHRSCFRDKLDAIRRAIFLEPERDLRPEFQVESNAYKQGSFGSRADIWCRNSAPAATLFLMLFVTDVVAITWGVTETQTDLLSTKLALSLSTAKALGRLLTFNLAITLLTSCKYLLTVIRSSALNIVFPSDTIPDLHRMLGISIALAGSGHLTAHVLVICFRSVESTGASTRFIVSGALITLALTFIAASTARTRFSSARAFRVLSRAHVPSALMMMFFLAFHTTTPFLILNVPPLLTYAADFALRRFWVTKQHVVILSCQVSEEDNDVVRLEFCRPPGFHFRAGQYIELNLPNIARYEYHPFTIASAPEDQTMVLFIKAQGRWTNGLLEYAKGMWYSEGLSWIGTIQGPFGSPSQGFDDFRNCLLIASGIGITPMTSVFEHLVNIDNYRKMTPLTPPLIAASSSSFNHSFRVFRSQVFSELSFEMLESEGAILSGSFDGFLENSRIKAISTGLRLAGARSLAERSFHSRLAGIRLLRGLPMNVLLSWVAIISVGIWICTAQVATDIRGSAAAKIAGALLTLQFPIYVVIILCSGLEFGRQYWSTFFFLWDVVPAAIIVTGIATAFSFNSLPFAAAAHISFVAANLASFLRLLFLIRSAALPTDTLEEKSNVIVRRPSANQRRRKPNAEEVGLVWVTRNLGQINSFVTERERRSEHYTNNWTPIIYVSRETASAVDEFAKTRNLAKSQVGLVAGRPNWRKILTDALERCHAQSPGRPLGVFFCGQMAVSSDIKQIALEVEVEHTLAAVDGVVSRSCRCRIVFREERFSR